MTFELQRSADGGRLIKRTRRMADWVGEEKPVVVVRVGSGGGRCCSGVASGTWSSRASRLKVALNDFAAALSAELPSLLIDCRGLGHAAG
ncbi:hypothetical protein [Micromonospora sp. NPDC003241]